MTSAPRRASPGEARDEQDSLAAALLQGQRRAVECVIAASATLGAIAERVADALGHGGRLIYIGAGSSGLLAQQDGLELPGTFGLDPTRVVFVTPGGERVRIDISAEDDEAKAERAVNALKPDSRDLAIAVSASGSTPFTFAGARRAKTLGAGLVAIVAQRSSPIGDLADLAASLDVGAEAVEGSTRLAAGTAQKAALGVISTLAAARLGLVHAGLMIRVKPASAKTRERARSIVARVAGVEDAKAERALEASGGDVAAAIVVAAGDCEPAAAARLLFECGGNVATALARLNAETGKQTPQKSQRPRAKGSRQRGG